MGGQEEDRQTKENRNLAKLARGARGVGTFVVGGNVGCNQDPKCISASIQCNS